LPGIGIIKEVGVPESDIITSAAVAVAQAYVAGPVPTLLSAFSSPRLLLLLLLLPKLLLQALFLHFWNSFSCTLSAAAAAAPELLEFILFITLSVAAAAQVEIAAAAPEFGASFPQSPTAAAEYRPAAAFAAS
jgi:hypothetical protein